MGQSEWFVLLLALPMVVSVRLALGLWLLPKHKEQSVGKRIVWPLIVPLPLAGPIFYGALYRIPRPHRPGERAPVNDAVFWGS